MSVLQCSWFLFGISQINPITFVDFRFQLWILNYFVNLLYTGCAIENKTDAISDVFVIFRKNSEICGFWIEGAQLLACKNDRHTVNTVAAELATPNFFNYTTGIVIPYLKASVICNTTTYRFLKSIDFSF